jgi:hypothetical protein
VRTVLRRAPRTTLKQYWRADGLTAGLAWPAPVGPPLAAQFDLDAGALTGVLEGFVREHPSGDRLRALRVLTGPGASYANTVIDPTRGERWFCSDAEAKAAGWRRAMRTSEAPLPTAVGEILPITDAKYAPEFLTRSHVSRDDQRRRLRTCTGSQPFPLL